MRYENGNWLKQEGVKDFYPTEAFEIIPGKDRLKLYCPTVDIVTKADIQSGVNLTIEISAPAKDVIRVTTYHHKGGLKRGPEFELLLPEKIRKGGSYGGYAFEETDDTLKVKSGNLSLVITKKPFSFAFYRNGVMQAKSEYNDVAYVKKNDTGDLFYDKPGNAWMSQRLSLSVDELVYGLGERFGAFVKNGQSIVIENRDGGTCSDQAYKNIPFYLSNRDYGVFVNHPETVEFEVGTEQVAKCGFTVEGEKLDYFFISGDSMKDVLVKYTDLTGKPALPPEWSFGLWLSTSFTTDYDTETVMSFVDGMAERGIPLAVFHFDCFWMQGFHWSDFIWDKKMFKDPADLLKALKERGLKICVWINPYIAQASALFDEGMEKGYLIRRKDGSVWQWDMWQPGLAVVDFTNPEATKWYLSKLKVLLDMGVDCFKTDFGERIPVEDVQYYDGSDPEKMHNYYTYLYNKAVYGLLAKEKGKKDAVVFARSATAGCQQFPVHWGGDCKANYDSMAESLRGGLSFMCSGFGYWAHDIGGFEDTATPDVYKRWVAFGLLSTHSRLHGSSSYRVPWLFDEEAVEVLKTFTELKKSLMPYLYAQAMQTSRTGIPMIRPMMLEFEDDMNCRYLDKQYMLGDKYLVAPVFNEEGMAHYYLPKGKWKNYFTGERSSGNEWRKEKCDYFTIPLWERTDV